MQLPPALEAKFNDFVGRYPVKRSALIPMMLYAQDHFGFLSDELLEEIAKRLDLNILQVTETLAYYSMLRRKPAGRYHIQVCTNISCMARGAHERNGRQLRGHHGQAHGPPRQSAARTEVRIRVGRPPTRPESAPDNPHEIADENDPVERAHR